MKVSDIFIKKLDHYLLVKEIKKGEKSTIYLTVDDRNDKLLVAKAFLNKYLIKDNQGNTNIKGVVENLIKLKHGNIIRIRDYKITSNNSYIITEYCNGGNLFEYQKYFINTNNSQFNELFIQKIIKQIVLGLEFIHNQKIIHGDINLQNILINFNKYQNIAVGGILPEKVKYSDVTLNDSFTLKISDLDISKKEGQTCPDSSLMSDCPNNMAPETVQSILNNEANKTYSSKIDIWALGEITYELLTGQHAFPGNNNDDIFKKILEGKYIFPAKITSFEILSFINQLLQFNPERRMNWEQIKSHEFLTKNVENFQYLELNNMKDENKNGIEINSKDGNSLFSVLFRSKTISENNENLNQSQKEKIKEELDEKKVDNKEIIKVVEDNKNNIEEQKKRLTQEIKDAERLRKESSKKLDEANIFRLTKEKIIKEYKDLEKKLNQEEKLKLEEEQELKNKLNQLKKEIQTMDSFNKENEEKFIDANKNLQNYEKIKRDAEKELTMINIKEIFSNENLSILKTETDILNFFSNKINECNSKIFYQFEKNQIITDFLLKNIEEIFKTNPLIKEITKNIYTKLSSINIEEIQSEEEYNSKIFALFGDAKLPQFLTDKDLKIVRCKSFSNKRNNNIDSFIRNLVGRNFTLESGNIIDIFESIRDNKIKVFDGINKKNELLKLFILINSKILNKPYFGEKYIIFLDNNKDLIKEYFNEDIQINEILENLNKMTDEKDKIEKKNLLNSIKNDINSNTSKIYIIISSFYYLLLYKFKDSKQPNNFGNIYITCILKNFVIFLNQNFDNLEKSLFSLLFQLFLFDINNTIYKDKINETYTFDKINSLFSKTGENLKKKFMDLKDQYQQEKRGFFTIIHDNINHHFTQNEDLRCFENIKLLSLDKKVYSNTITIIVDMFSNPDKNQVDEWREFINYFDKETMFYFYQWSYMSKEALFQKGNYRKMKKKQEDLIAIRKIAKLCGKFLAYILISKKFFREFQINLVGFGLGCYVIKECIKLMSQINHDKFFVKIKNVILIGASMNLSKEQNWKKYIEETVVDKFINCYSQKDEILKKFYYIISKGKNTGNNPIGLDSLQIKNENGKNLIINYDFTENNFDQLSYDLGAVVKKIFEYYKDI